MSDYLFKGRLAKGTHHWKDTCHLCNQWILKDEEFYMLIVPTELRLKYRISNFIAHKDEWDKFVEGLSNDEEIVCKLLTHKKPRKKPLTKEQLEKVEYFKQACNYYGFNKCVMSRDRRYVKMGKNKTSFTLIYDIIYDKVSYDTKANEGLFGGLFSVDLVAKVENKFYELAGEDKHNNYSSADIIKKAIKDVDDLMGK